MHIPLFIYIPGPGHLPNFNLETCEINAAMCCCPQDRQANYGNVNCNTPYDEDFVDKNSANNADLCYVDNQRRTYSTGIEASFSTYRHDHNEGDGPIHYHGFAWANDKYDFTTRYKTNNLFYVSMYDHMYHRGYVRNIPGAPTFVCVEQVYYCCCA